MTAENGPILDIVSLSTQLNLNIEISDTADQVVDEHLEEVFGIAVDYASSEVVDIEMDGNYIVAVVDVGPVNRTMLIDTISGSQLLLSDPVWPSSSPSIAHGRVAFLQIPRFDPTVEPEDLLIARDVFLHNIDENLTVQLTIDDDVDQSNPQVLHHHRWQVAQAFTSLG